MDLASAPVIIRTGDLGISAEWRDLSYDWTPLLTPIGVSLYEQCRDTYDQQRALYPFLLSPQGPTKQAMQRKLGLRTGFALQGPEYLLATVGLLQVEVGHYGPSADPERPNHTRVAYYMVGRLDHPTLDWPILDRLLDALSVAITPRLPDEEQAAHQKKATAALRSLGQAGFLQRCDPEDLFYPLGAWPTLLPVLIADPRWEALFAQLHGGAAMHDYRRQARAWAEYAERLRQRLRHENDAIRDQVLAAQRGGPGSGGASIPPRIAGTPSPTSSPAPGPAGRDLITQARQHQSPATAAAERTAGPGPLRAAGIVAAESLPSRQPDTLSPAGHATVAAQPQPQTLTATPAPVAAESLAADQLTDRCRGGRQEDGSSARRRSADRSDSAGEVPSVAAHLRDEELASTRYDAAFWCAVNHILAGRPDRYRHTPGEKKAVERRFKRQETPVGVVLAALRAVMCLPPDQQPDCLAAALAMPIFQRCVEQAWLLLPTRDQPHERASWPAFLQAYRSVGLCGSLRNVSVTDYQVLLGLFQSQPGECWEVLNRVEHAANTPDLSPAYLRQALINNQQAAARHTRAGPQPATSTRSRACAPRGRGGPAMPISPASADDPCVALLQQAGLSPQLLQPWMTPAYIQAWLDEAAARPGLENVQGWLVWGLGARCLPQDHPRLPPRPAGSAQVPGPARIAAPVAPTGLKSTVDTHEEVWRAVLRELEHQLPRHELETWFESTALLDLDDAQAIIGVPHIFARDQLAHSYQPLLQRSLRGVVGRPVEVCVVIS